MAKWLHLHKKSHWTQVSKYGAEGRTLTSRDSCKHQEEQREETTSWRDSGGALHLQSGRSSPGSPEEGNRWRFSGKNSLFKDLVIHRFLTVSSTKPLRQKPPTPPPQGLSCSLFILRASSFPVNMGGCQVPISLAFLWVHGLKEILELDSLVQGRVVKSHKKVDHSYIQIYLHSS